MRSVILGLLLVSTLACGWTFKTVSHPFDSTKQAYLKKDRQGSWYLILPNDAGFQVYILNDVQFDDGMVSFNYTYGPATLYEVQPEQQCPDIMFFFNEPPPFNCDR